MALSPAEKQRAYRERLRQKAQGELPTAPALCNIPPERRWSAMKDQAQATLQQLADELEAYIGERSEEWHDSERGQTMQERLDALTEILADLDALPAP